jgi:hypothetical protein
MDSLKKANPGDLEFLLEMDEKFHEIKTYTMTANMSGTQFKSSVESYKDALFEPREIQRVLDILDQSDFAFYPINTNMGLSVGFRIANPETKDALLTFRESQLPEGYDFKMLSGYFMKSDNVERAKSLGVEIVDNRSHYDY